MIRYDLRRLLTRATALAVCCFSLGLVHTPVKAAFSGASNAQAAGWTVNWGQNNIGPAGIQWTPALTGNVGGGAGWAVSGGALSGAASGRFNNGPGYIDVQAKVVPTKPTVAGALGRLANRLILPLALIDFARDMGYALSKDADGNTVVQKADPAVCTVAPCYAWQGTWSGAGTYATQMAMCNAYSSWSKATVVPGGGYFTASGIHGTDRCIGATYRQSDDSYISDAIPAGIASRISASPQPAAYLPSSDQEFIDSIALASGWPTSANFPKAVAQAVESGEEMPGPVTVTGPATSQGSKTTTTDSSGNVTEKQTLYNYTYNNNTVNYTTSVVTTVNGVTQSTTVTEGEKNEGCDGSTSAQCADLDTPQTEVPKSTKNLTYAPEELGLGGGSCPAPIPINTSRGNWAIDLAPYCTATTTYVRPMVILVAMFIAYLIVTGTRSMGDD